MSNPTGYITNEEITEFQLLCKQFLGRDLTLEEAEDQGTRVIMLFEALQKFEPVPLSGIDIVDESVEKTNNEN